jgi:hypothetical protein
MSTTERPTQEAQVPYSLLGNAAVGATVYFVLAIAAMHVLSPAISPITRPTSEYAIGPFGYLMTSAFLAFSIATWCLVSRNES